MDDNFSHNPNPNYLNPLMLWRCQRLSETGDESQLDLEPIDLVFAIAEDIDNCVSCGDLVGAISQIERAILLFPTCPNLYAELAHFYAQTGDIQQATANYDLAIDLNPTDESLQHWQNELDDWTWDLELPNLDTTELDQAIEAVGDRNVWRLLDSVNYG